MTKITFETIDNRSQITASASPGETVMLVAVRNGVEGIIGECGGEMSCATCHVKVRDRGLFLSPTQDELDLLELAEDQGEDSRLGCQLKITASTPDFTVTIPRA